MNRTVFTLILSLSLSLFCVLCLPTTGTAYDYPSCNPQGPCSSMSRETARKVKEEIEPQLGEHARDLAEDGAAIAKLQQDVQWLLTRMGTEEAFSQEVAKSLKAHQEWLVRHDERFQRNEEKATRLEMDLIGWLAGDPKVTTLSSAVDLANSTCNTTRANDRPWWQKILGLNACRLGGPPRRR